MGWQASGNWLALTYIAVMFIVVMTSLLMFDARGDCRVRARFWPRYYAHPTVGWLAQAVPVVSLCLRT